MEDYLTVNELSDRIKFSKQSIYNLIHNKRFVLKKHYLKPTPKKILFKWSAILEWMGDSPQSDENPQSESPQQATEPANPTSSPTQDKPKSQIKI